MQCSAVQCSAVKCSEVQFTSLQCTSGSCNACSAVQFSKVHCTSVQCSAMQCSGVQCSAVQFSAVQCNAAQCSGMQMERDMKAGDSCSLVKSARCPGIRALNTVRALTRSYSILDRRTSVRSFVRPSRSWYPPCILKGGGLESSGQRLISLNGQTKGRHKK